MSEGRIIGFLTYKQFAKKYGIRLTTLTGKKKTMNQLARCRRSLCRIGLDRGISRALRDYKRDPSKSIDERTF